MPRPSRTLLVSVSRSCTVCAPGARVNVGMAPQAPSRSAYVFSRVPSMKRLAESLRHRVQATVTSAPVGLFT